MGFLTKDQKPNFLFVHIPKSAGTFIIKSMKRQSRFKKGLFEGQHRPMWMLDELCKEQKIPINTLYTFSVVRDPWARMLSMYKYAILTKSVFPQFTSTNSIGRKASKEFNTWIEWIYSDDFDHRTSLNEGKQFPSCSRGEGNLWRDWFNNQSDYFKTKDGTSQYKMDKIIRVEDFGTQIKPFLEGVLGCTEVNPHDKVNTTDKREHYSTFYNQQSIDLVSKHFSKDIEMFDYEFIIK
ncbi:MAG: sulfotransferase family protein [Deltaproteobacteria bacterium]|nr:sulfotransferase family protein [Deltaproteobacteria bacterium]